MTHTKGKMTAGGNVMDDCIKIRDELIGVIYPCEPERKDEALANARRLAACWNACEGIPTESMEIEGLDFLARKFLKQRDALLAALGKAAKWIDDSGELSARDTILDECEAAIAAVKAGAA